MCVDSIPCFLQWVVSIVILLRYDYRLHAKRFRLAIKEGLFEFIAIYGHLFLIQLMLSQPRISVRPVACAGFSDPPLVADRFGHSPTGI